MNDRDTIIIMDEEYNIADTEETVSGASIVIDGPLKMVLDKILCNNPQFDSYNTLIKEAVYLGLIEIINSEVNPECEYANESYSSVPEDFDKTQYVEIPFDEFEALRGENKENNIEY
ncbi:MAG: hypothetical protein ACRCWM_03870 [Sarcina sp.]